MLVFVTASMFAFVTAFMIYAYVGFEMSLMDCLAHMEKIKCIDIEPNYIRYSVSTPSQKNEQTASVDALRCRRTNPFFEDGWWERRARAKPLLVL